MPAMSSELILRLHDGVTGPARAIDGVMQKLGRTIAGAFGAKAGQGVTAGAAAMRREAAQMERSAAAMSRSTHAFGTAMAGLGVGHGFGEFVKAGADYRKELIALQNSGKTSTEIARAMKAASEIATSLPTQTFADSIKIINETTAAYGDLGHALENLSFNSKFESNMKSVLGNNADPHMLQNLVKALEIRGTAFNPEKYQEEAGKLGKAFAFSRGAVNPENFYDFAKNSNPDIKQFSTQFLTEVVPSLIQTMTAPGAGTGIKAFEKVWRGGLTDKSQAAEWVRVGMVSAKAVQDNKGQSPGWKSGMAEYSQLARENPMEAMTKLLAKLQAIGVDIADPNKLGPELDKLFKNGRARAMAYELGQAVTRQALTKDAGLIRNSADMDQQYNNNKDDIYKARDAIRAAFENLMASMSGPLITSAAHGIWNLAIGIQHLASTLAQHPMLGATAGLAVSLGTAAVGVAVLRSGFAMLGLTGIRPFAMMRTAMTSMRAAALESIAMMGRGFLLLLNPLALVRGAVFGIGMVIRGVAYASGIGLLAAAGALIYQNWDNIRVALEAFRGAFMRALAPVMPILQPIIDDIATLWDKITSLIAPTSDMGDGWAKAGIKLGTLLGQDILPWAQAFRTAYDWVKALSEALMQQDWGAAFGMIRAAADPVLTKLFTGIVTSANDAVAQMNAALTKFFTGWVTYAEQGAAALMSYDWVGLGARIVQAIIQGIENMGAALAKAFTNRLPGFMGFNNAAGESGPGTHGGGGARLGDHASGGSHGWKGNYGQTGWWTADRQSHAVDRFMKEAGLSETGAKAAVARMVYVEAPGGPASVNPKSGAEGIGQWLGPRKGGGSNGSYDDQLGKYIGELNGPESTAKRLFNTPGREAEGASAMERAEGYAKGPNAGTHRDNYTDRVAKGIEHIHHGAATGAAPSPAGTSAKAITDAEVFAARQRIINGGRDPRDREIQRLYKEQQAKPAGARASGGGVAAGRSYLVGERGMELFTPGAGGQISPHDALTGALRGGGKSAPRIDFRPHIPVTIHGGGHMNPSDVGQAVAEAIHGQMLAALEATHSDKD